MSHAKLNFDKGISITLGLGKNPTKKWNTLHLYALLYMSKWLLYDAAKSIYSVNNYYYDKRFFYLIFLRILNIKRLDVKINFLQYYSKVDMKDNLILRWIEFFIKNSRNTFPIINSSFFRIKPKNRVIKFSQYFFLTSSFFLFAGANYTSFLKVLRYKKYLQITSKAAYLALPTYFHGSPRKFWQIQRNYVTFDKMRYYIMEKNISLLNIETKTDKSHFDKMYKRYFYRLKNIKWIMGKTDLLNDLKMYWFRPYFNRWIMKFVTGSIRLHNQSRSIKLYDIITIYSWFKLMNYNWMKRLGKDIFGVKNLFPYYTPKRNLNFIYSNKLTSTDFASYYFIKKLDYVYKKLAPYFSKTRNAHMDNVFLQVWYVLKKYLHITFANIFMDARFPYTDDSYLLPENSKMIKTLYNLELIVWEIRYRYIAKELNLGKFDIKQIMIYKNIIRYTKSLKYIDKKLFYEFFDLKNNGTFLDWIYFIVLRDIIFKIVIKNNAGLLLNTANVVNRFKQKKLILWQISFYQRYYKYRSYELTNPSMLALDFSIPVNAKYAPFYNYKGI